MERSLLGFVGTCPENVTIPNTVTEVGESAFDATVYGAAVDNLMKALDAKAARLMEAGNYDGAINVYSTDIGELAPESLVARERKIRELEQMRRNAAADTAESDSVEGEESRQ